MLRVFQSKEKSFTSITCQFGQEKNQLVLFTKSFKINFKCFKILQNNCVRNILLICFWYKYMPWSSGLWQFCKENVAPRIPLDKSRKSFETGYEIYICKSPSFCFKFLDFFRNFIVWLVYQLKGYYLEPRAKNSPLLVNDIKRYIKVY